MFALYVWRTLDPVGTYMSYTYIRFRYLKTPNFVISSKTNVGKAFRDKGGVRILNSNGREWVRPKSETSEPSQQKWVA